MEKLDHMLDEEELLSSDCDSDHHERLRTRRATSRWLPSFSTNLPGLVVLLTWNLLCCAVVFGWASHLLRDRAQTSQDSHDWEFYSPVLDDISLPFHTKQIDSRIYINSSDPTAIFAAPPSPEVDAAWERISDNMIYSISREDVLRVGKDPSTAVKYNSAWDTASPSDTESDRYLVEIDVFHQIHCLNSLRMALIHNYDHYFGKGYGFRPPAFFDTHLRHCTWNLLQSIMCHADVGVVTHLWSESQPQPWPDFGINKQCRDFDALLEWKEKTDLPRAHKKFSSYTAPVGAKVMPIEEGEVEEREGADAVVDGEWVKELHIKGCNA